MGFCQDIFRGYCKGNILVSTFYSCIFFLYPRYCISHDFFNTFSKKTDKNNKLKLKFLNLWWDAVQEKCRISTLPSYFICSIRFDFWDVAFFMEKKPLIDELSLSSWLHKISLF